MYSMDIKRDELELEFDLGISGDLPPTSDTTVDSRIDGETLESGSLSDDRISSSAAKTANVEAGDMDRLKGTASLVITKKEKSPRTSPWKSVAGMSTEEAGNDLNKGVSSLDLKKQSNEFTMNFKDEPGCFFDEELPPSCDTTIDSRISKNSIKTNNSKGMPMAIIKDDAIMIENKKTLKKKVSFKKMEKDVQIVNEFETQDVGALLNNDKLNKNDSKDVDVHGGNDDSDSVASQSSTSAIKEFDLVSSLLMRVSNSTNQVLLNSDSDDKDDSGNDDNEVSDKVVAAAATTTTTIAVDGFDQRNNISDSYDYDDMGNDDEVSGIAAASATGYDQMAMQIYESFNNNHNNNNSGDRKNNISDNNDDSGEILSNGILVTTHMHQLISGATMENPTHKKSSFTTSSTYFSSDDDDSFKLSMSKDTDTDEVPSPCIEKGVNKSDSILCGDAEQGKQKRIKRKKNKSITTLISNLISRNDNFKSAWENTDDDQDNSLIAVFDEDKANFVKNVIVERRKLKIAFYSIVVFYVLLITLTGILLDDQMKQTNSEIRRNEIQSSLSAINIFKGTSNFSNIGNIVSTNNDGKTFAMVGSSITTNSSLVHIHDAILSKNTIASYEVTSIIDPNTSQILNVALSGNGNYLIIATNEYVQAYAKSDNDNTKWVTYGQQIKIETQSITNIPLSITYNGAIFAMSIPNTNVLIHYYSNNEWLLRSTIQKPDNNADNFGNSISLSSNDGNRIIIGADYSNNVFVYEYANYEYIDIFINQPLFDSEDDNSKFGYSVSINNNGNRIAIGSPNSNLYTGNTLSSGRCNIYDIVERSFSEINYEWIPIGQQLYGEKSNEHFGTIISLNNNGNIIAISSPGENIIRVYELSNENWVQLGFNFRENDDNNTNYGDAISLSLDGNTLFAGSPPASSDISNDNSRYNNSNLYGKTYVYGLNELTDMSIS